MSKFIIEVRTKGFGKAETELKRVSEQTRTFARRANKSADAGATFRREVSQLRNNMLLYTFAIGGAIVGMGKFIKAASDAREQASQFRIVFGEFAGEADSFATSIQSSFGIAKSEMVQLLAGLQDTFVPLGFSREQASKLSMSIAQLSLDVGSFKNIATGDVAQRFTSALIGNHEAVRSLGISLTEATIKQEAMNLGIIQANEEMTQEAKILGRMSLMFKGTSDAQGDLNRTQEEFANRLRGTSGRLKTLQIDIGNMLIPFGHLGLSMVDFLLNSRRVVHIITGISVAMGAYAASAIAAAVATNSLSHAMRRNLIFGAMTAGVIAIDALLEKIGFFGEESEDTVKKVDDLGQVIDDLSKNQLDLSSGTNDAAAALIAEKDAVQELKDSISDNIDALELRLALMHETTELGKVQATVFVNENRRLTEKEIAILKNIDAQIQINNENKEAIRIAKEQAKLDKESKDRMQSMADATISINREAANIQMELDGATELTIEKTKIVQDGLQQMNDKTVFSYEELAAKVGSFTDKLSMESLQLSFSNEEHQKLAEAIVNLTNKKLEQADANALVSETEKNLAQDMKDTAKEAQIAAGALNAVAGAINVLKANADDPKQQIRGLIQLLAGLVSTANPVAGAGLNIFGALIAHTGGLVKNNSIQRFATGGVVKGEDNVPILAQSGEFIMQRSAVQNIGVANLAAMNRGESSGGVTVNIQGNMVGNKEFIRNNLIPEIKRASQQELA
tara:strand:+ start:6145 stop:8358 length:2214 start_codon:yes stop_codon:yes gene_type:complete